MKSTAALAMAAFGLAGGLTAWMVPRVAEYPGVPRDAGTLPSWFVGAPGAVTEAAGGPQAPAAAGPPQAGSKLVEVSGGTVDIALVEYEFKPQRIRLAPGKVTFVLRNEGRYAHDFHVEGPGVDAYAARFGPGRTVHLEVELPEGEYKISCPLSNHDERGMHGKLVVTARAEGG